MTINHVLAVFFGLASGAVVSGAVFAFIATIGIVPRMAALTKTARHVVIYEEAIIWGGILTVPTIIINYNLPQLPLLAIIVGLAAGVFVGVLAMSLAEVLGVIPILLRRIKVKQGLFYFVLAIALGKVVGSILYFVVSGFHTPEG